MSTRDPLGAPGPTWGEAPPDARVAPPRPAPHALPDVAPAAPGELAYAGFGRRISGLLVDGVVFAVLFAIVAGALSGAVAIDAEALEAGDPDAEDQLATVLLVLVVATFAYGWLLNTIGWSPGKQALGLRVVRADGQPPGLGVGFARTVCWPLSLALLGLGLLWPLFDRNGQAWHDKLAGTYVVRV